MPTGLPINLPERRLLGTIQGARIWLDNDGSVSFTADADIDCDGGPNPHNDPCWQSDTTLHYKGQPINAEEVPFIVVPPLIVKRVQPIVLGCRALVRHRHTGKQCRCVVADLGPSFKVGELSPAAATAIGINPHPITGGESEFIVDYKLWPGQPAVVNGILYSLQPYHS